MHKSTESFGRRITMLNKATDAKLDIQQERIQKQLDQSIATTDLLRVQVDTMQQGISHLQASVAAILQKLDAIQQQQQMHPNQGSPSNLAAYGAGNFATSVHGGMQPPPPAYGAGHTMGTPGQAQFSTPSRQENSQPTSLHAATQMQHMNAGYNPKFMSPMYNPAMYTNIQAQQYPQQQLTGTHSPNMEMSPPRVAV
eukprot:scaffold20822_cov52-Attheya_sp.AAC.5